MSDWLQGSTSYVDPMFAALVQFAWARAMLYQKQAACLASPPFAGQPFAEQEAAELRLDAMREMQAVRRIAEASGAPLPRMREAT